MADLVLNLKGEYFNQIKSGEKEDEYRLFNEYWQKRLLKEIITVGRVEFYTFKKFENIVLKLGYPKKEDTSKHLIRPWRGIKVEWVSHPHFGFSRTKVFAIRVN